MCLASACTWFSPIAARTTPIVDTGSDATMPSMDCAFCRSIRRWTSSVRRPDSLATRPEK